MIFVGQKHKFCDSWLECQQRALLYKLLYRKLIHLKKKQYEHEFYIHHDGRYLMELLHPLHLLPIMVLIYLIFLIFIALIFLIVVRKML